MTPNIALGGNAAIESVVSLCNHLHRMLARGDAKPSRANLIETFAAYQAEREERVKYAIKISGLATRIQAMTTLPYRFAAWVTPWLPERGAPDQLADYIRGSPKIEYLSTQGFPSGRVAWKDDEEKEMNRKLAIKATVKKDKQVIKTMNLLQMTSASVVALVMIFSAVRYVPLVTDYKTQQLLSWIRF